MMNTYSPPETYQQWLECFRHLQEHPLDQEMLKNLSRGRYLGKPSESFLVRMSDTLSVVITLHCRRFLRQVDQALADGEADMIPLLASRLKRHLNHCFFYRDVSFLDVTYIQNLDRGFGRQLISFWQNFLAEMGKSARESMDAGLEDVYFELKRMKFIPGGAPVHE